MKISDNIPDGNASKKIGKAVAVVIKETNKGFGEREVISHEAPTSYMAAPIYEKRAALHNVLYMTDFKGLSPDFEIFSFLSVYPSFSAIEDK